MGIGKTVNVTGPVVVAEGVAESVALTTRLAVPAVVGVPVITHPVAVSPAGSVPLMIVQE